MWVGSAGGSNKMPKQRRVILAEEMEQGEQGIISSMSRWIGE